MGLAGGAPPWLLPSSPRPRVAEGASPISALWAWWFAG